MKKLLTTLTVWLLSASLACAQIWFPTPNSSVNAPSSVQMCLNPAGTATCAAVPAKTNYLTGYDIEAAGATAAAVVNPTITGLLGGTRTMTFAAPLGAVVAAQPLMQTFNPPLQGSAVNTAISVSMPALGAGATNATVNAQCFYQ